VGIHLNWWDRYEIINAHAHISRLTSDFGVSLNAQELRKLMRKYNYSKCIIMNQNNAMIAKIVSGSNNLFANVWVNPKDQSSKNILRTFLKKENFIGIKLHPLFDGYTPDSPIVYPIAEIAEEFGVPIQLHCGHPPFSLPWSFEPLARKFPNVKLVLVHMGHGHIVYINAAISIAERNKNIYLETSGMPMHTKIKEAINRVGKDKVMYGDDLPCGHPSWELEKARAADLTDIDMENFLGGNAKKLYNLD
jgi:hypothetical protein